MIYDLEILKSNCVKFSREYVYDDSDDSRPSHILYTLYNKNNNYNTIQLNPYITNEIYLFNDEEIKNFEIQGNFYIKKV